MFSTDSITSVTLNTKSLYHVESIDIITCFIVQIVKPTEAMILAHKVFKSLHSFNQIKQSNFI